MSAGNEQRSFARVQVGGRVLFRTLDRAGVEELAERLKIQEKAGQLNRPGEAETAFELAVMERLDGLEAKLDAILELLLGEREEDRAVPLKKARLINLSASGLFFLTREREGLSPEDRLEVRVIPQGFTGPPVTALARVIHLAREGEDQSLAVGVSFEAITEADQERLVGYTFNRMRLDIQAKQQGKGA
jgi:hypothetical protein